NPCSMAAWIARNWPPSEKLSGVTLRMPMSSGRRGNSSRRPRNCQQWARVGNRSLQIDRPAGGSEGFIVPKYESLQIDRPAGGSEGFIVPKYAFKQVPIGCPLS